MKKIGDKTYSLSVFENYLLKETLGTQNKLKTS